VVGIGVAPVTETLRCEHCGEVIGVYEPLIVRADSEVRETSRAADSQLSPEHGEYYHLDCHQTRCDDDSSGD
jgi:hypothetical protein